jgi:hypothetical protein
MSCYADDVTSVDSPPPKADDQNMDDCDFNDDDSFGPSDNKTDKR